MPPRSRLKFGEHYVKEWLQRIGQQGSPNENGAILRLKAMLDTILGRRKPVRQPRRQGSDRRSKRRIVGAVWLRNIARRKYDGAPGGDASTHRRLDARTTNFMGIITLLGEPSPLRLIRLMASFAALAPRSRLP